MDVTADEAPMYAPIDGERGGPGRGLEALLHVRCFWMSTCKSSLAAFSGDLVVPGSDKAEDWPIAED